MTANPNNPFTGPDTVQYGRACDNLDPSQPPNLWEYRTSEVLGNNSKTDGVLYPTEFYVWVRPGIPVNVTVRLLVPTVPPIDFFVLQDASVSMESLIKLVLERVPEISDSLKAFTANSSACVDSPEDCVWYGQSMYLEKPISPFANYPESFIYLPVANLSNDLESFKNGLNRSAGLISRNWEHPEDGFEALLYISQNPTGVGYRYNSGVFHICMLVSDATCHVAGEGKNLGIFTPNNADGFLDGYPPGTGEDYPSLEQVREALVNADVSPLFAVAPKITGWYQAIVDSWGFGAVVPMDSESDVVSVILNGTKDILSKAALALTGDPLYRFDKFADPPGGLYGTAIGGQYLYYTITVLAPLELTQAYNKSGDIKIKYVGFGNSVTIKTYMNITCVGCIPGNNTAQIDFCGICGGNNNCRGCDGVLGSGYTFDACGVCAGDNSTCQACDGFGLITTGGKSFDLCGVCGGDNSTCKGCDGIPNSGKEFNDCPEKVCGGGPNCPGIETAIIAIGVAVAVAGIIAGIAALIVCAACGAAIAREEHVMHDKEAQLQENPLYEEAKKKFDNPLYAPTMGDG